MVAMVGSGLGSSLIIVLPVLVGYTKRRSYLIQLLPPSKGVQSVSLVTPRLRFKPTDRIV